MGEFEAVRFVFGLPDWESAELNSLWIPDRMPQNKLGWPLEPDLCRVAGWRRLRDDLLVRVLSLRRSREVRRSLGQAKAQLVCGDSAGRRG